MSLRPLHLVFTLALVAAPARGTLSTRVFVESEILGIAKLDRNLQAALGPLVDDFDFSDPVGVLPGGEAHLFASADYGILHLDALFDVQADDFDPAMISIDGGASASGGFMDQVTIAAPGLSGTSGTFVPVVDIDGELDAGATGEDPPFVSFAEAGIVLTLFPSGQQRARACNTNQGTGPDCLYGDPLGVHVFEPVAFTFGSPFNLSVSADAGTFNRTVPGGTTHSDADFRFTVRWLGIQDVFDQGGSPVASFQVTSASGTDWALPVFEPDPRLGGLAGLGLAALLARGARAASVGG
jgi:hypothetical protein